MNLEAPHSAPVLMAITPHRIANRKSSSAAPFRPMKNKMTDNQKQTKAPIAPADPMKYTSFSIITFSTFCLGKTIS